MEMFQTGNQLSFVLKGANKVRLIGVGREDNLNSNFSLNYSLISAIARSEAARPQLRADFIAFDGPCCQISLVKKSRYE